MTSISRLAQDVFKAEKNPARTPVSRQFWRFDDTDDTITTFADDPKAFRDVGILRAESHTVQPRSGHRNSSVSFPHPRTCSGRSASLEVSPILTTNQPGHSRISLSVLQIFFVEQLGCNPETWGDSNGHVFDAALSEYNRTGAVKLDISTFCSQCNTATSEAFALCLEWYAGHFAKSWDVAADYIPFNVDCYENDGVLRRKIDLFKHRQSVLRRLLLSGKHCTACEFFGHGYEESHLNSQKQWPFETKDSTDEVFRLARRWLRDCLNNHEGCRRHEIEAPGFVSKDQESQNTHVLHGRTKLPKRLIQIDSFMNEIKSIRLVYGADLGRISSGYLALSHCWGGARIVQLTTSNLDAYLWDISLSSLPATFSDTIRITNLLGYSYLWIDSLCILQDSKDDWNEQAAQMGSVYRNSAMTIAALGARSSQDGCYLDREFKAPNLDRASPLHSRAWAVQERCLSTRTLNFGMNEISWDCIEWKASESRPRMVPTNPEDSLKRRFYDILNFATNGWRWRYHWIRDWWEFVQVYTACDLTFATDRWPAFQGLSTEIQRERKRSLLHGLWLHRLVDELLWYVPITQQQQQRLSLDAPSWSWLSTTAAVKKRHFEYTNHFQPEAQVTPPDASHISGTKDDPHSFDDKLPHNIAITARMARIAIASDFEYRFGFVNDANSGRSITDPYSDGVCVPDIVPDKH